ncbi:hypothetical protein [Roseovarius sp. M141]|uniref:hypothetical protein n=1 Tax=Roseovarius sp. M141 TaxID=2583806 RepID=UPI0020CB938B|nr:hypothetical protein [Roseovarius sp. M141]MCQ0090345.1 hypothetical protein [Roseovarius sp. M141]
MYRSDTASGVSAPSPVDAFADRFTLARPGRVGGTVNVHARESTGTAFINGLCKVLLTLAVLGLVAIGGVFAFNVLDLKAKAGHAVVEFADDQQARELDQLRSEVALLSEQSLELRSELALLTGQGGVLPKLVGRLQDQRKINGAHSNAIRQLYATTGLIGASLPAPDDGSASETAGSRPIQVTPVAVPVTDAPKRVVLIPDGNAEATPKIEGGDGE